MKIEETTTILESLRERFSAKSNIHDNLKAEKSIEENEK